MGHLLPRDLLVKIIRHNILKINSRRITLTIIILIISVGSLQASDKLLHDPIINHAKLATGGNLEEFQYCLKRCAGLLLSIGTAQYKLSKEEKATSQKTIDLGENLLRHLAKFQIKVILKKELNQDTFSQIYRNNLLEVTKFNRLYYKMFLRNVAKGKHFIEEDTFLMKEATIWVGMQNQLLSQ